MPENQRTILIIDDSVEDRETYRRYLLGDSKYNYTILEEEDGEKGLKLCRLVKVDAILLDFLLPDIDGLEFLKELKTGVDITNLPVVMLTGQGNEAIAVQAMKSGASDYLVKGNMTAESFRLAIQSVVEQTHLKKKLEQSEQRFRTSVENMLDCFGIYTSIRSSSGQIVDFLVEYVNRAACASNRMTAEEQIGKRLLELLPYYRETKLFDDYCLVVEGGEPLVKEVLVDADIFGNQHLPKTFDIRAAKLDDGVVVAWRDITAQKLAEAEIIKALDKEKELSSLRSRFISIASHDLRTPLTSILSAAECLEHYSYRWTEEKKLSYLHRIQASVKEMTALLNDVLLLATSEAGKIEFNPAPLDLIKFCRQLTEEMQLGAGEAHTINFISGTLPLAPANKSLSFPPPTSRGLEEGSVIACMDTKLLRHIFTNLLSNAIKYSPQGGSVYFKLTIEDGVAIFQVQDEGIGIPPQELPRVFESFHRGQNVGSIPGTGLGLSIVKTSCSLHGGTITVESELNKGASFTVCLPLNYQSKSRE